MSSGDRNQYTRLALVATRARAGILATVALLGTATCIAAEPGLALSAESRATLDRLLRISEDSQVPRTGQEMKADRESFIELLATLGGQIEQQTADSTVRAPEQSVEHALVAMAMDRAAHPERYEEILEQYVPRSDGSKPQPVVLRPKDLEPDHLSQRYRLVWESLILEPPSDATILMGGTALEAVALIRDDRSIPVLVHAIGNTCQDGVPQVEQTMYRQILLLQTLARFANATALEGILEGLSLCQVAMKDERKFGGYSIRDWTFRLLTDQNHYGNGEQWLAVLKQYPKVGLADEDRELLDRAISFRPRTP